MTRTNLLGYTPQQMESIMRDIGQKAFHGRQLFKWLYKMRQYDFSMITDLSKELRQQLEKDYYFEGLTLERSDKSEDLTEKFLFRLSDGKFVESVLIPDESGRQTVCVSSQVGCALGCKFCATGMMGLGRDLTVGEIVGQLIFMRDHFGEDAFTNIVLMGMGEPLLNLDNVATAIDILSSPEGMAVAAKKVTISTAGVVPGIRRLADLQLKSMLAVSLNAATQEKREQLMPIAKSYPLDELIDALKYYTSLTHFRVTLEYILFKGFNDTMEDVMELARLIRGLPCKINLLAYNPIEGVELERPSDETVDWFAKQLYPRAPAVTVRRSRGTDIAAACGQLAARQVRRSKQDA